MKDLAIRGGHLHNEVLIRPLNECALDGGARTSLEYSVRVGTRTLFIDLVVIIGLYRIAVEAELTPKRVQNDIEKATAFGAHELWIVTPTTRSVKTILNSLPAKSIEMTGPKVFVLTQGQAVHRIVNCFPVLSQSKGSGKQTQK